MVMQDYTTRLPIILARLFDFIVRSISCGTFLPFKNKFRRSYPRRNLPK